VERAARLEPRLAYLTTPTEPHPALGRLLRATPESLPKRVRQALLEDPEGLPAHLERVLVALEAVSQQIVEADTELRMLAEVDQRTR